MTSPCAQSYTNSNDPNFWSALSFMVRLCGPGSAYESESDATQHEGRSDQWSRHFTVTQESQEVWTEGGEWKDINSGMFLSKLWRGKCYYFIDWFGFQAISVIFQPYNGRITSILLEEVTCKSLRRKFWEPHTSGTLSFLLITESLSWRI